MPFTLLGEAKFNRQTVSIPVQAAVAHATRDFDYIPLMKAPSDHGVAIKSIKLEPAGTVAADGANYFILSIVKIRGTTVSAVGTTISQAAGGLTLFTQRDLVTGAHNAKLNAGERLALKIDHVGTGMAHLGLGFHIETEII